MDEHNQILIAMFLRGVAAAGKGGLILEECIYSDLEESHMVYSILVEMCDWTVVYNKIFRKDEWGLFYFVSDKSKGFYYLFIRVVCNVTFSMVFPNTIH